MSDAKAPFPCARPAGITALIAALIVGTFACGPALQPAPGGVVGHTPNLPARRLLASHPLARPPGTDVRVVAYNIWKNSIMRGGVHGERFTRVARALDPDIWLLQEVWSKDWQVKAFFNRILPLPGGRSWHVRHAGTGVTVSRWPFRHHRWSTGRGTRWRVGLTLVDLPDARFATDLYAVNVGMTCCGGVANDPKRQAQADELAAWLRDVRSGRAGFRLPRGTPIVVGGDLNIIAGTGPVDTVRTGDITNEVRFGRDAAPDWDGTDLTDAHPRHNGSGGDWTWRSDGSPYPPGRLDYILFSDSVLRLVRTFALETTTLTAEARRAAGLQARDVVLSPARRGHGLRWDHLPLVADFQVRQAR